MTANNRFLVALLEKGAVDQVNPDLYQRAVKLYDRLMVDQHLDDKLDNSLYIEQKSFISPSVFTILVGLMFLVMSAVVGGGIAGKF